ncbi:hypothetical protein ISM_07690 [Roseovarius nubinhibens ISM]|uniref:Uncharacterized protein n=1 Tax=Roseovarius nubinhibens (strain ATCC BAA-591 / DSM 15170 / ISM) TaxID=89187 RepID=A3SLD0_ROSNI|nr:hypothetical protein ISM_07690 [Roseovarius nubinhibens ISM]
MSERFWIAFPIPLKRRKPRGLRGFFGVLVAGGRSELNLRGSQDKLVAGKRNQLNLLIFAPDFSAWRYAS